MNASALVAFIFAVLLAVASALPVAEEFPEDFHEVSEETGVRTKRATCDLLSVSLSFGSLNHAACAAHCLALRKGFRGGRCRDGVCHCRR